MDDWAVWADDYRVGLTNDLHQKHIGWRCSSIRNNDRIRRDFDFRADATLLTSSGAEVSLDLRSIINHEPSFWLVAFLAFALGFYWEFRRASS